LWATSRKYPFLHWFWLPNRRATLQLVNSPALQRTRPNPPKYETSHSGPVREGRRRSGILPEEPGTAPLPALLDFPHRHETSAGVARSGLVDPHLEHPRLEPSNAGMGPQHMPGAFDVLLLARGGGRSAVCTTLWLLLLFLLADRPEIGVTASRAVPLELECDA